MSKNPILRRKLGEKTNNICGDVLEEIKQNNEIVEAIEDEVSGGDWVTTLVQGTIGCLGSWVLGNPGKICTWTVECQNNCRE